MPFAGHSVFSRVQEKQVQGKTRADMQPGHPADSLGHRRLTPSAEATPPDFPGQAESGREKDNFETGLRLGADTGHGRGVDEDGQFGIGYC